MVLGRATGALVCPLLVVRAATIAWDTSHPHAHLRDSRALLPARSVYDCGNCDACFDMAKGVCHSDLSISKCAASDGLTWCGSLSSRPDVYAACSWGSYDYKITAAIGMPTETASVCVANVFALGQPLQAPFPRSSYNYDLDTRVQDAVVTSRDPRIDVVVSPLDGPPTLASYRYRDFEARAADVLFHAIPPSRGVFRFDVVAFDYDLHSSTCSACLSVSDYFRPQGNASLCPPSDVTAPHTAAAVQAAQQVVAAATRYRATARNNPCSDRRCDRIRLAKLDWLSSGTDTTWVDSSAYDTALDAVPTNWLTCFTDPFSPSTWTALVTNVFGPDPDVAAAPTTRRGACARTCRFDVTLQELFTPYTCNETTTTNDDDGTFETMCVGSTPPQTCTVTKTLQATVADFIDVASVDVVVKAKPDRVVDFVADPATTFANPLFRPFDSATNRELHVQLAACDATKPDYATYCATSSGGLRVGDLFGWTAAYATTNAAVRALFPTAASDANAVVFWRYRAADGATWAQLRPTTVLRLTQAQTTLLFEAYTQCGFVASTQYTIHVHRTTDSTSVLPTDDWFNCLWNCGLGMCNEPASDFRVCRFSFNPRSPDLVALLNPATQGTKSVPVTACQFMDTASGALMPCTNGCNSYFSATNQTCNTGWTAERCNNEALQMPQAFKWCPMNSTALLSQVDVKPITYTLSSLDCKLQYTGTSGPSSSFLNLTGSQTSTFKVLGLAIQMRDKDAVTRADILCTARFKSTKTNAIYTKTHTKTVLVQNCDAKLGPYHPLAYGPPVKGSTCDAGVALSGAAGPYQACAGSLGYSSAPLNNPNAVTKATTTPLPCCNKPGTLPAFKCLPLANNPTVSRCSESLTATGDYVPHAVVAVMTTVRGGPLETLAIFASMTLVVVIGFFLVHKRRAAVDEGYYTSLDD
ncbi:Aste57867_25276 [Aphanomyces stellatus]|uniref:Aste57867_25276 protein n=1 Tax=Aphanomyces stellatus TaxID=120398 RepID=A0A485LSR3_9STRA|nr:hypothetical protein As57867_025198 [Aphanomyces stellatus]VFU01902.1 Aste57867_25276 [Aphanomyces stellatus]